MRRSFLLISIFLILLVSCTSTSWVNEPYKTYSRDSYLVALGYGETAEKADLNAKTELASLFGLRVSSVTTSTITENLSDYDESFIKASSAYVDVDNLYGVEIARRTIEKDGRYVSLAVMEKRTTLQYLEGNIESEEDSIYRAYEQVEENLGSLSGLESASNLVRAVRNYNTRIAMINYLAGESREYLDEQKALEKWQEARDSIKIAITVDGDDFDAVKTNIANILTSCGLRLSDTAEDSNAVVDCQINIREVQGSGVAASFVFAEYDASISLIDSQTRKTILSYSLNGKEGHQNFSSAKTRAIKDLNDKISSTFGEELKGKFAYL